MKWMNLAIPALLVTLEATPLLRGDAIVEKKSKKITAVGKNSSVSNGRISLYGCKDETRATYDESQFAVNKGNDCDRPIENRLPEALGLYCAAGSECSVEKPDITGIYFPGIRQSDLVRMEVDSGSVVFKYGSQSHKIKTR